MKRCWLKSAPLMVLILTSLLFLPSCGMPNYLNLDGEVTLSDFTSDGQTISGKLEVSSTAASKLTEFFPSGKGPAIKLFYMISSQPNRPTSPITDNENDTSYKLSLIDDYFNTIYRTTQGNGRPWSPEDSSGTDSIAPAYYLYTDSEGTSQKYSISRPDDLSSESKGILVGTFGQSMIVDDQRDSFMYGSSPEMDIPMTTSSTSGFGFTISKHAFTPGTGSDFPIEDKQSYLLEILTDETPSRKVYLTDYRKFPFPKTSDWTNDDFNQQYLSYEDNYFYKNLLLDYSQNTKLYLHIYGAVFAGEGDFTNIYWSKLAYLGYILLD